MKKLFLLLSILVLTLCLTGCMVKTEEFEGKGVTIVLTSDFEEVDSDKWDFYVENDKIAIMSNRVGKLSNITDSEGNKIDLTKLPLEAYLLLVLSSSGIEATTYVVEGYYATFHYCYYTVGTDYGYMMLVTESDNFFYTINICTDYDSFQESKPLLLQYAVAIQVE